ncbi:hypothetical protein KXV57_007332 [Aspergillus fumigatus]|uniref:Luciferase-like domain-containing protein n=1 Tax=Aspergillus fumigatus TaxID=746128 RepID=A0A9P8SS98_ASPFM|nr:hypothetical protein KXV57_007332 [Aspergillus fumigatus]
MGDSAGTASTGRTGQKHILLNAFDMSTVGHLSPGQWKNPNDKSATKRSLEYWIELAKLLERGGINALFLADTFGGHDTYQGKLDECIRRAAQWPVTDPSIPISAMAAVTKHLTFAITSSTSSEAPFLLAKRFSTLDHMTQGRFGWNIVTSYKKAAFKAIGLDSPIEHDERYRQADEYLRVLYKGRGAGDPRSIKVFATFTPILGRTDEEARAKYEELKKYASVVGGLVLFSGWTGIDISRIPLDQEITAADSAEAGRIVSILDAFTTTSKDIPRWTPRVVAEKASIGGLGPVAIGSAATVADEMERWIVEADLDGFNIGHVSTPGTFEDVVELLVPELRRRGLYPEQPAQDAEALTARERVYGKGQRGLRADHPGSRYKYDVYVDDA